jgi:glycine/D-amino acid oxidase-like deaminating enzyme/nitrite reductase/ring-hydroxylating ferredoxin subunit
MKAAELVTGSYWEESASIPRYPRLDRNLTVDTVVIGGGITGLTAAYLLKRSGQRVAVIDRRRCGGVDSALTTAHVTCVTDLDLTELVRHVGRDHAWAAWDAGLAAIQQLDSIIEREGIDCEWTWVNGYKHAPAGEVTDRVRQQLQEEASIAKELGFEARFVDAVPFVGTPGVEYGGQAKFHPRKYLSALTGAIDGDHSFVFEHSESEEVRDDPLSVRANGHTISCGRVVIATHTPLMGKTSMASAIALQTKLYLYSSYVLGGRLPSGLVHEASYWDTQDPYHYLRIDARRGFDYAIFGGEDHKTGQGDPEASYRALEATARKLLPRLEITHRWSGQVIETNDGLPFIGETSEKQFAATGYAGNGMTFGTLAGMMACDWATGRRNPWRDLFDPGRTKLLGGTWDYIKENADYPYYLIRDRFAGPEAKSLRAVRRGEGRIVELARKKVAAYRSETGATTLLSPVCTHMGCDVTWNGAERTWDCPCHGSRFTPTGQVLAGPAETPLERVPDPSQRG